MGQALWTGRCDPQAPLVVIGAGRSGSTLLAAILAAHPDLCFKGETVFLLPKLWRVVWECVPLLPLGGGPDDLAQITPAVEQAVAHRLAPILAQTFVSILNIDPACSHWGYK